MHEVITTQSTIPVRRLTDEEVAEALKLIEELKQGQEEQLRRRKGKLVPSSVPLIRKDREERSRAR